MTRQDTGPDAQHREDGQRTDSQPTQDGTQQPQQGSNQPPNGTGGRSRSGFGELLASAAVRWGIGLAGLVLFLFAIGQAVGLNLLGMFAEALSSQTGQWLLVAVFALFLIAVARRGIAGTLQN